MAELADFIIKEEKIKKESELETSVNSLTAYVVHVINELEREKKPLDPKTRKLLSLTVDLISLKNEIKSEREGATNE